MMGYQFSNVYKDGSGNLHATLPPGIKVEIPYSRIIESYLSPKDYENATEKDLVDILEDWVYYFDIA